MVLRAQTKKSPTFFEKPTKYAAPPETRGPKRGCTPSTVCRISRTFVPSYPRALCPMTGRCVCVLGSRCEVICARTAVLASGIFRTRPFDFFWAELMKHMGDGRATHEQSHVPCLCPSGEYPCRTSRRTLVLAWMERWTGLWPVRFSNRGRPRTFGGPWILAYAPVEKVTAAPRGDRPSQSSRRGPAARATRCASWPRPCATTIDRVPWAAHVRVVTAKLYTHRNLRADCPSGRPTQISMRRLRQ